MQSSHATAHPHEARTPAGAAQGRRGTGGRTQKRAAHMKGERGERQRRDGDEGGGVGRRRPRAEEALRLAAAAVPKYRWADGRIGRWNGRTDIRWMATTARRMRGCSQSIGAQGAGLGDWVPVVAGSAQPAAVAGRALRAEEDAQRDLSAVIALDLCVVRCAVRWRAAEWPFGVPG